MHNPYFDEATPLMQHVTSLSFSKVLRKVALLFLFMKTFGNALLFQMTNFNLEDYTTDPNNTNECTHMTFKAQGNAYTGHTNLLLTAAATFLLPALGGIISDKYFGCVKVLIYGTIFQFWVSVLFPTLVQLSVICHNHSWFFVMAGGLTIATGLVDPLLIYGLMKNATGSQSRKLLVFAYFIAAPTAELLGTIPSLLRYFFRHSSASQSFEFVGVLFTTLLVICMFLVSRDNRVCEKLSNENFEFPRLLRLRRYYIIVTAFFPFAAVIVLCINIFYWKEMKYYTKNDDGIISATIVSAGYQLGTILFSLCGLVLVLKGIFPKRLTLGIRIRLGLLLMISTKLILFVLSFAHSNMSQLGQSHPLAVQTIYFAAAFSDGAANALTDVAMYELVDCIAERCAKAMYIGIFYTIWGLGLFVTGIVVKLLRLLPSEGKQLMPEGDVQPQFYIRYAIVIFLLLISYVYYANIALPLAEPLVLIKREEDLQEQTEDTITT